MDMHSRSAKKKKSAAMPPATGREDGPALPERSDKAATLTKSVYEQIRADVLSGKLRPGETGHKRTRCPRRPT